jgi:hypothetical protein
VSTIDPDARLRSRARRNWWPVAAALCVLGGGAVGAGIGFGARAGGQALAGGSIGLAVGLFVGGVNMVVWGCILGVGALRRRRVPAGRGLRVLGLCLLGAGVGALVPAGLLLADSGTESDTGAGHLGALIGCFAGGVLLLGVGAGVVVTALQRSRLAHWVISNGQRTTGTITATHATGSVVNGVRIYRVTVRFTDLQGVQRYVQGRLPANELLGRGTDDPTPVWYDPQHPENERTIVVDLFA